MIALTVLAPLFLAASSAFGPDTVRISLFTLFKPQALNVRIVSGEAVLDAPGVARSRAINQGELIRIRRSGNRLNIVVAGSRGGANQSLAVSEARIAPSRSAKLELILPGKIARPVRGEVSVDAGLGGRGPLRIVLITERELAVASIVAAEMGARQTEALKALSVVVRTYMLAHAGRHSAEGFDFCDTTHCQLYRGEDDLSDEAASVAVTNAVARTAGQVLTFHDRPIEGFYSAVCGGESATPSMVWGGSNDYPYGRVVCRWCKASRFSRWERSANAARVVQALSAYVGSSLSPAAELIVDSDQPGGFVRSVGVRDAGRQIQLSADAFRRAIGLKLGWNTVLSPTFTVERRGFRFVFRGRGFGSQVGLCEAGAVAQAAAGRGYREILSFYYPAAEIGGQS